MPTARYLSLISIWTTLAAGGLLISLLLSNPRGLGPIGVTIWFVILFIVLTGVGSLLLYGTKGWLHLYPTAQQRLRSSWRQALLFSSWATTILALSSLHQLNLRDAILLALILGIVEGYLRLRQQ